MDKIVLVGRIVFSPKDKTKKHNKQSNWKKIAMVLFEGDVSEYYAWFIKKRFNLTLNKPLRGAHISFINDSINDIMHNGNKSFQEAEELWNKVKLKWDSREIPIMLNLSPKTNSEHWWLNVDESRLHEIRGELGLGKPFYGLHMSLGYANERNINHSIYIHELIKSGLIN